jgi:putative hydrolase of the HAD superfamily
VLDAVFFDWGDTLMRWAPEPDFIEAGHAAGLRAIGRAPEPEYSSRFHDEVLPQLFGRDELDESDYTALVRDALAACGIELDDEELTRFLEAEHGAWRPAVSLASTTHALLDALRERGLRLGLVSNAVDPPWLLHRDLAELGLAERLDVALFSSETGWRKPHPAMFEQALAKLEVDPARTLFVGDNLVNDVGGAAALGIHTCQALWFVADATEGAPEPEFQAFTQMDVLTVVGRLA